MLIIAEGDMSHPHAVKRRAAVTLNQEEEEGEHTTLVSQGIPLHQQQDDQTLMQARYKLDKERSMYSVETSKPGGPRLSRVRVYQMITTLMSNQENTEGGTCSSCM